jgi:hypothetical protein
MLGLGSSVSIFLLLFMGGEKQPVLSWTLDAGVNAVWQVRPSVRWVLASRSRELFFTDSGRLMFFHEIFFMLH